MRVKAPITEKELGRLLRTAWGKTIAVGGCPGLYVCIAESGEAASWILKLSRTNGRSGMGLGPVAEVSMAQAREDGLAQRRLKRQGLDPILERRRNRTAQRDADSKVRTVAQCTNEYLTTVIDVESGNAKHLAQWRSSVKKYLVDRIGHLDMRAVDNTAIVRCLSEDWLSKNVTLKRVQERIEKVFAYGVAHGYCARNPAKWKGNLDHMMPKPAKVRIEKHHASIGYGEMPAFIAQLKTIDGANARALEFIVYTAARLGEAVGARWDEIDFAAATWSIPGSRMKSGKPHMVPLSKPALAVLRQMPRSGPFVFTGTRSTDKPIAGNSLNALLKRMGRSETVHGMRSAFRVFCQEQTDVPREVAEMALAHRVMGATEASYARSDLLSKRAALMATWARWCSTPLTTGEVVPLKRRRGKRA